MSHKRIATRPLPRDTHIVRQVGQRLIVYRVETTPVFELERKLVSSHRYVYTASDGATFSCAEDVLAHELSLRGITVEP